ncbi:hypothetical protein [Bacillus cereus]|uniref:hypothetical protein n=1 Tax=Bacillus cereus TaxID=1396 RepID=UPI001143AE11|nr:hypothetical protein [Bacillus cereus]
MNDSTPNFFYISAFVCVTAAFLASVICVSSCSCVYVTGGSVGGSVGGGSCGGLAGGFGSEKN